ncbi:unnamed protein product [Protopolystoma xenopodis]|uniref:Uncharacterized protein n=1 Tax=Protopolystoma xenopodis TaxID=117903 RepID=A0A448WB09_9PLAT|nr:unnamed protein product [Protopolystoma xenopodis]
MYPITWTDSVSSYTTCSDSVKDELASDELTTDSATDERPQLYKSLSELLMRPIQVHGPTSLSVCQTMNVSLVCVCVCVCIYRGVVCRWIITPTEMHRPTDCADRGFLLQHIVNFSPVALEIVSTSASDNAIKHTSFLGNIQPVSSILRPLMDLAQVAGRVVLSSQMKLGDVGGDKRIRVPS